MIRYVYTRMVYAIILIIAVVIINFLLIHVVPGDPVDALLGEFPAPPEYVEKLRHDFGLDRPLHVQLWRYLEKLAVGDLGFSFANRQPVISLLARHAGNTLLLMIPGLVAAAVFGLLLGAAAARKPGSIQDTIFTAISLGGYSLPIFWLAQMLIVVFAVFLGWLPAQGMASVFLLDDSLATRFGDYLLHLVLPGVTITVSYMAIVARVSRTSLVETSNQDFRLLALTKGLSPRRVFWRHVLPNALIPVVTVIGYNFGLALTGAILTETVFGWPGLGYLFITSIQTRDYPVMNGIFLLAAFAVVLANFLTDITYALIDPRVSASYKETG